VGATSLLVADITGISDGDTVAIPGNADNKVTSVTPSRRLSPLAGLTEKGLYSAAAAEVAAERRLATAGSVGLANPLTQAVPAGSTVTFSAGTPATPPSCFASEASVQTRNGAVMLKDLEVGADMLTASGYESVIGFLHSVQGEGNIVTIQHAEGELRVTENHIVMTAQQEKAAAEIVVGDEVMTAEGASRVLSVRADSTSTGLSAPLTKSGHVTVDGVQASAYATVFPLRIPHSAAHVCLFAARVFPQFFNAIQETGADSMHPLSVFITRVMKADKVLGAF